MKELKIKDKAKYLAENYPLQEVPEVYDRKRCIHCDSIIVVGNYKVYVDTHGVQYICCPNTPECDGSVIDWIDVR